MDGSSRILHNFLVFLGFLALIGSADEFTYTYLTRLHDAAKCMLNSSESCDRVPPGTFFNDTSFWGRYSCYPASMIDYSESTAKSFPMMKMKMVVGENEPIVFRRDEGTCQNYWAPGIPAFDPLPDLYESGCVVMHRWGCQECQMGWTPGYSSWIGGGNVKKECHELSIGDFEDIYGAPMIALRDQAMETLKPCPSGRYQGILSQGCLLQCTENCRFCRDSETCDLCETGFVPTAESRYCVPMQGHCPKGYFRVLVACVPCDSQIEGCAECKEANLCTKCKSQQFLVTSRHYTHCVSFCPDGFYWNETTRVCIRCPPYCKRCEDGNGRCLECLEGLYSLQGNDGLECYNQCPFNYFGTNAFPFWCLPCHRSCIGCQNGPTEMHCLNCLVYGTIGHDSRIVSCTARRPPGVPLDQEVSWVKDEKLRDIVQRTLELEVGVDHPIGPCKYPLNQTRTFTIEPNGRIGSNFFMSMAEADNYFRKNMTNSNASEIYRYYAPHCVHPDCLKNCVPLFQYQCKLNGSNPPENLTAELGNFDPCPKCLDGYTKSAFSNGSCVSKCLSGSFRDPRLNKCILTPWPSKCEAGEWIKPAENTDPYNFTYADYEEDPSLMRIRCTKLRPRVKRVCNLTYEFETDDGQCLMCHSECLGCTGYGSHRCIQCRNVMYPSEHCITACPEGYEVNVLAENVLACNFILPADEPDYRYNIRMWQHTYSTVSVEKKTVIPACYCLVLIILEIAALFVSWFTDRPRDTDADLVSWRYERLIAMEVLEEFEAQWKKKAMSREPVKVSDRPSSDELRHQATMGAANLTNWNRAHGSAEWSQRKRKNLRSGNDVIVHRRPQVQRKATKDRPRSKEDRTIEARGLERTQKSDESLANTQRSSRDHSRQAEIIMHTPPDDPMITAEQQASNEKLGQQRMSSNEMNKTAIQLIQKKASKFNLRRASKTNVRKLTSGGAGGQVRSRSRSSREPHPHRVSPHGRPLTTMTLKTTTTSTSAPRKDS